DAGISGNAYFITNGQPLPLWEMVNRILAAADIPPVTGSIPPKLAYTIGAICEGVWGILRLPGEPPMTRFVAHELSTAHWFNVNASRRDFGYQPEITIDEGLERLRKWFQTGTA
ncbi:MAG: 3-beta hydroxysteroid dehydrogenase, partial [Desulfuromonadaceae bacterium]|nr:3-beta hydroxysteroid dehydrogenase [Desulfuromonadaceae bacterium]